MSPDTGTPGEISVIAWYHMKQAEQRERSLLRARSKPAPLTGTWIARMPASRRNDMRRGRPRRLRVLKWVPRPFVSAHVDARLPDESDDDARKARNARKRERRGR